MVPWIELTRDPLHLPTAMEFIHCAADSWLGGINVFVGVTRGEKRSTGELLVALDYEAYGEMALGQMQGLGERAAARWPISRLLLLHRIGRVDVGQPSVVIAVATPHRAEAFEACRWLIDTLKAEVAIWKRDVWEDGAGAWAAGHPVEVSPSPPTVP
jgi:molybdopterin synthase catalytic subunit